MGGTLRELDAKCQQDTLCHPPSTCRLEAALALSSPAHVTDLIEGRDFRMLIAGELVAAEGGATLPTYDPSTGAEIAQVPAASRADVDRAVQAAKAAQPEWQALGVDGRAACFAAFGRAIEERF